MSQYDDNYQVEESGVSNTAGQWLGWIGIILGIIALFWTQGALWCGIIGLILGIIGVFSPQKGLNWAAIIISAIALIIYMV